jgi:hypothetical protein
VTHNKERKCDLGVPTCHHPPCQILEHAVVFVLPCTVVSVKEHLLLAKAMMKKEVVQLTHYCVGSLATSTSLITEEIDLPGNGLTIHPKHRTFPRSEEIYWARLHGIRGIVHLLSIVKRIVDTNISGIGW